MIYLKSFKLVSGNLETEIPNMDSRRIYNNYYPLHIFPEKEFENIDFANITIFYGGNGSGKTTLLNMISQKLNATRKEKITKGSYFDIYVNLCEAKVDGMPSEIKMIASDDIFDYLLNLRAINNNVNRQKEKLSQEYLTNRMTTFRGSYESMEQLRNITDSKMMSASKYVRQRLINNNLIEQSNGESALMYWEEEINENAIYILDEPENSLSAENQLKLKQFISDSSRFYNCQFIISTHSPFLLSLKDAKIYDF